METIRKLEIRNIKLAIAFVALNILDAALTVAAMSKGGVSELNPIMRDLLGQPGWVFWGFKIGMALIFAFVLLILSNRYPRQIKRIFVILIAAMLGICLFNMMSLL